MSSLGCNSQNVHNKNFENFENFTGRQGSSTKVQQEATAPSGCGEAWRTCSTGPTRSKATLGVPSSVHGSEWGRCHKSVIGQQDNSWKSVTSRAHCSLVMPRDSWEVTEIIWGNRDCEIEKRKRETNLRVEACKTVDFHSSRIIVCKENTFTLIQDTKVPVQ